MVDTPLSPTTLIDSILWESLRRLPRPHPSQTRRRKGVTPLAPARLGPTPHPSQKCLSIARLDNLTRAPQMSGVARLFPCPSSSLHGRVQPGLALSHWGGRRALPELGPLPSRGPDPSPAGSTQPCLVNGRPRPSATGTGPPGLWGPCQHPELPTDRGWPRCCADRPSLRRGQGLLVRSRQAWSFQAGTRGEAGPATAEHGS